MFRDMIQVMDGLQKIDRVVMMKKWNRWVDERTEGYVEVKLCRYIILPSHFRRDA